MRRSEASQAYEEFLCLKAQVVEEGGRISRGGIEARERLWTLVEHLKENIEVFNEQEKEEILSVSKKVVFPTPLLRSHHRSRSRSESVGRSRDSSVASASFLSADMSNVEGDSLATLMEAKLAMEEEMEEMQAEQKRKVEEMERAQRKKERDAKRQLIARAAASGVNVETLGLVEDTASRPLSSSLNTGVLGASTSTSSDDITRLIGSQRVRAITIKEEDKYAGGCLLYTSPSPRDATLSRMPSSA